MDYWYLVAVAGSVIFLLSNHNNTGIIINTNGTDVLIQTSSWFPVPDAMLQEMKIKALVDVEDANSSVSSIKTDMQNIASKYNYHGSSND